MTVLSDRLQRLIAATGPISVADYMAACLFDPEAGYYTTREPFGVSGDFTTAPEISQMFGELVAIWVYSAWQALGRSQPVTLAEIGPGRGTLMRDTLRTLDRLDRDFCADAGLVLIEASPRLIEVQRSTLADAPRQPEWLPDVAALPDQPLLLIGNELFDALPVRQFVRTAGGWRERMVGLGDTGSLAFTVGMATLDPAFLPPAASNAPEGAIFEHAPARTALMEAVAAHIAARGGAALFIDYGHAAPALGDTLQAVRRHAFDDVLAHPGEADLTTHVDFAALVTAAEAHGLSARLMPQGKFLLDLGLLERAGTLGADADEATREQLRSDVERLAGPDVMGQLFKVLAVAPKGVRLPPTA